MSLIARQGNGVAADKHWERSGSIIHQVKPFLPPPLHQSGHGDFKVRIYPVPDLDMDDRTAEDPKIVSSALGSYGR
jgi:hypothetical protein